MTLERDEKMDLIQEQEKYRMETEMQRELWAQETTKLRKELDNINEIVLTNQKGAEENLKVRLEEEKNLLITEYDGDRQAYQKLLQEYHCLEQHCETLETQLNSQNRLSTHIRNASDVSSISTIDENMLSATDMPEDHGYGSVRSNASVDSSGRGKLDNIDWSESASESNNTNTKSSINGQKVDVGLVLQLQHKLADTEREKVRLQKRLDEIELSPKSEKAENAAHDAIRIAQLELANSKLKTQLFELTDSIEDGNGKAQLTNQMKALQEELERRSEEIIQLKGVLANQTDNMKSIVNCRSKTGKYLFYIFLFIVYMLDYFTFITVVSGEYINEDGELALAYETQKTINKQLELELQDEKAKYKAYEKEFKLEIEKLREDNERQQRLLSANLSTTPQSQTEAFMHHEITRLTTENLDLQDQNDTLNETIRKLKKQIKILSRKLKEGGLDFDDALNETIKTDDKKDQNITSHSRLPAVRKKEKDYLGMFLFKSGDENVIMRHLVVGKCKTEKSKFKRLVT